jgi:hypothetical protein
MNGNLARISYNPTKPGHRLASAGKNNHSIKSSGINTVKTKLSGHQDQGIIKLQNLNLGYNDGEVAIARAVYIAKNYCRGNNHE